MKDNQIVKNTILLLPASNLLFLPLPKKVKEKVIYIHPTIKETVIYIHPTIIRCHVYERDILRAKKAPDIFLPPNMGRLKFYQRHVLKLDGSFSRYMAETVEAFEIKSILIEFYQSDSFKRHFNTHSKYIMQHYIKDVNRPRLSEGQALKFFLKDTLKKMPTYDVLTILRYLFERLRYDEICKTDDTKSQILLFAIPFNRYTISNFLPLYEYRNTFLLDLLKLICRGSPRDIASNKISKHYGHSKLGPEAPYFYKLLSYPPRSVERYFERFFGKIYLKDLDLLKEQKLELQYHLRMWEPFNITLIQYEWEIAHDERQVILAKRRTGY